MAKRVAGNGQNALIAKTPNTLLKIAWGVELKRVDTDFCTRPWGLSLRSRQGQLLA